MGYAKHTFVTGETIQAEPFNEMDSQIAANEAEVSACKTALLTLLGSLKTLIPQAAYTVPNHQAAEVAASIDTAIATLGGSVPQTGSDPQTGPTYTSDAIYTNFTASGARFSTDNISINFDNGDYIEAKIDATACTEDATNIFCVAVAGNNDNMEYTNGEGVIIFKRVQSSVDKILFRVKDTANEAAKDVWVTPADMSDLTICLDKSGVYLDGEAVSGIKASDLSFLTGGGAIMTGARASKLSYATYKSVTVYRAS